MELAEALDIVAEKFTPRFRDLCDENHPDYDPAHIPIVLRMAQGLPPHPPRLDRPLPPPSSIPIVRPTHADAPPVDQARACRAAEQAQQRRLKALAWDCLYADQPGWRGCGCRGCFARGTSVNPAPDASLRECLECVANLVSEP